jgi:hypothetical protein
VEEEEGDLLLLLVALHLLLLPPRRRRRRRRKKRSVFHCPLLVHFSDGICRRNRTTTWVSVCSIERRH